MKKLLNIVSFIMIAGSITASYSVIPVKTDTPLIKAVKDGNYKLMKNLLKRRHVSINELGIDQKTALDVAVEYGDSKIALYLTKKGGKVTRSENIYYLRSMFKDRGLKSLITFAIMLLCGGFVGCIFQLCIQAVECISLGYLALAIPVGVGVVAYAGYMWSRPFKAYAMYTNIEKSWMLQIPEIA